ncbi:MAG TPA: DUF4242 domain-containing protein [Albitalea sp.]|uniref:DUF4242 domain-containing protein n=1 Tax=Piscinibacter sp. TaxID=1903157 RepID=UPI002ED071D3
MKYRSMVLAGCLALVAATVAHSQTKEVPSLQTYVIERDLPGAGKLSAVELQAIARKSNGVLAGMGAGIQWVESYVTADKIYCVYRAQSEEAIRKHADAGGFPANRIARITGVIDPTTAR